MTEYVYRVVPFSRSIKPSQGAEEVSYHLQTLINHHAASGWEFHRIGEVVAQIKDGGPFAWLRRTRTARFDQLIFRKARG